MIYWDEDKNTRLITERGISFDEISELILREEYLDILENPNKENQMIFIVRLKNYVYVVPFIIDENDDMILKTAFPSRKFNRIYGDES
jgi:uncharacterized DUF497 family protein